MSEPIFRYWDQFNGVYSKTSDRFKSMSMFFNQYERAKEAGNNPVLEQFTGRRDKDGNRLFAGDIIQVAYHYPGDEGQPFGHTPAVSGHFIGVIRYQPSKGFVMSRVIEWVDVDDYTDHVNENDYKKKPGAMQFSASYTTKIGNINQHPQLLKEGTK